MPWVALDDAFPEHPKIAAISNDALAIFVTGLAYCNRNLTDGFIPEQVGLGQLRYCDGMAHAAIDELVGARLWKKVRGGWVIHDYADYQRTREQVEKERERTAQRVRDFRKRKRGGNGAGNAVTEGVTNAGGNAVGDGVSTDGPQPQALKSSEALAEPKRETPAAAFSIGGDVDKELALAKLLEALKNKDNGTPQVIRSLALRLPAAALHEAREVAAQATRNDAGLVVRFLQRKVAEREAA